MITLEPKQAQLSYTFLGSKQSQTNNFSKKKKWRKMTRSLATRREIQSKISKAWRDPTQTIFISSTSNWALLLSIASWSTLAISYKHSTKALTEVKPQLSNLTEKDFFLVENLCQESRRIVFESSWTFASAFVPHHYC